MIRARRCARHSRNEELLNGTASARFETSALSRPDQIDSLAAESLMNMAAIRLSLPWALCITCVLLLSKTAALATIVNYNPSLNTLPDTQGFSFSDSGGSGTPTVSGGILNQGPTSFAGTQFWFRNDVAFNFDTGFAIEVNIKIISSSYDPNAAGAGSQRSGWYMEGTDALGRRFIIGIDSNGVVVNTDATLMTSNGMQFRGFDMTNAFHDIRLVVSGGVGTLFVDSVARGSTAVGPVVDSSIADRVFFGDGSGGGNSQTQLSLFRYSDSSVIPEPGTASYVGLGIVSLVGVLLRRKS